MVGEKDRPTQSNPPTAGYLPLEVAKKSGLGEQIERLDHLDMYSHPMPDNGDVYFTHGDFTVSNVIVSRNLGSYRVRSIMD